MGLKREIQSSLASAAAALGLHYASGRAPAAFYAQMGRASWLGVALSALLFGLLSGAICGLARRTGSRNICRLFHRVPFGTGRLIGALYGMLLFSAGCMLLGEAAHAGALMLPCAYAETIAAAFAALCALALAFSASDALLSAGSALALMLLAFEWALLCAARAPQLPAPYFEVDLKLQGNAPAAIAFALLHACAGICLSAGMIVRFTDGGARPVRRGLLSGAAMLALLSAGNAALQAGGERSIALQLPFAAISSRWGGAGFYGCAGLMLALAILSLSGIIHGLLPENPRRNRAKNDVKL